MAGLTAGTLLCPTQLRLPTADSGHCEGSEAPAAGEAADGPWAVPGSILLQPGGGGCELFDSGDLSTH